MKTLGLLRNLMSKSTDIDNIMSGHSDKLMLMVSSYLILVLRILQLTSEISSAEHEQ